MKEKYRKFQLLMELVVRLDNIERRKENEETQEIAWYRWCKVSEFNEHTFLIYKRNWSKVHMRHK